MKNKFKKRIFLGHPFTNLLKNNLVRNETKNRILKIIKLLELKGYDVSCALVREKFGEQLMSHEECTPLDFLEIRKCDIFLAFPSNSGGVHIELGWASALGKEIILFLKEDEKYSPLVNGLTKITNVKIIRYNDKNLYDKLNKGVIEYGNK